MPHPRALLPLAVATPLLLASDWRGERATFHPKAGTSLTKTIEFEVDQELEEMQLLVGGQDMSERMPEFEMTMKHRRKLVVSDTYDAVEEGRPTRLERAFETISVNSHSSSSTPVGDQESDMTFESELEGNRVVFTYEDGSYRIAFAEGSKGDEKLLDGLEEDIDLRGFLPSGEVNEGDTWKIDPEAIRSLLIPGGDLALRPTEEAQGMPGMESMNFSPADMLDEIEGTFEATFAGTRSEGGAKLAQIRLSIELTSANDLTEVLESATGAAGEQLGAAMEVNSGDGEIEYEAEGELLWNLDTGLVHGLTLSGELRMVVDISMSMSIQGQSNDMEISQTYGGNQTITVTTGD